MLLLALLVLIVSILITSLAWRGRVSERGVFCRRCRFDLQGTDLEHEQPNCPECGSDVGDASAQRETLRAKSKPWLVAGALLMLLGLSGLYISFFVKNSTIYTYMPDRIVLSLAERGTDEAIDETIRRLSTPGEFSDVQRERLYDHALLVQEDRTLTWDLRWGQVLLDAISTQTLNDKQLSAFVTNGYRYEVILRDRIRQGDETTPWAMRTTGDRVMTPFGGVMPYQHSVSISAWGIVGQEPIREFELPRGARTMVLQGSEPSGHWHRSSFQGAVAFSNADIGTEVELFIDYRVRLLDPNRNEPVFDETTRQFSTIQIIAQTDAVVDSVQLGSREAQLIDAITISPVGTTKFPNSGESGYRVDLALIHMLSSELPAPIAMRVYLRIGDDELEVGSVASITQPGGNYGHQISWRVSENDTAALNTALIKHTKLLDVEAVDLIMRPEPDTAIGNPEITEVLDVSLIFRDIPVRVLADRDELRSLWNEETEYKGEVLVED